MTWEGAALAYQLPAGDSVHSRTRPAAREDSPQAQTYGRLTASQLTLLPAPRCLELWLPPWSASPAADERADLQRLSVQMCFVCMYRTKMRPVSDDLSG